MTLSASFMNYSHSSSNLPSFSTPRLSRHRSDTMLSISSTPGSSVLDTPLTPSFMRGISFDGPKESIIRGEQGLLESPDGFRSTKYTSDRLSAHPQDEVGDRDLERLEKNMSEAPRTSLSNMPKATSQSITDFSRTRVVSGVLLCEGPESKQQQDYFSCQNTINYNVCSQSPNNHVETGSDWDLNRLSSAYQPRNDSDILQEAGLPNNSASHDSILGSHRLFSTEPIEKISQTSNVCRPRPIQRSSWLNNSLLSKITPQLKSSSKVFSLSSHRSSTSGSNTPSITSSSRSSHSRYEKFKSVMSLSRSRAQSVASLSYSKASTREAENWQAVNVASKDKLRPYRRSWTMPPPNISMPDVGGSVTIQDFEYSSPSVPVRNEGREVDRKGKGRATIPLISATAPPSPLSSNNDHIFTPLSSFDESQLCSESYTPILSCPSSSASDSFNPNYLLFTRASFNSPLNNSTTHAAEELQKIKHESSYETLPKELQIMVMEELVKSYKSTEGKLDGTNIGRKELIRLSSISKDWERLCFDGQLWSIMHLAPIAYTLHPSTLSRIINHSARFILELSCRGMDRIDGQVLFGALAQGSKTFSSLQVLDLRGCKVLASEDLSNLIFHAPNVLSINLKALHHVDSSVLSSIAEYTSQLKELDVTSCPNTSTSDISSFVSRLDHQKAARLVSLRAGYLSGRDDNLLTTIAENLVNLERLDIQGCTDLEDKTIVLFTDYLGSRRITYPLKRLNLSSTNFTPNIFSYLSNRLPNITHLEMADLPAYFDSNDDDNGYALSKMLKTMPKMMRLDLEDMAGNSGVTDSVLRALTPGLEETDVTGCDLKELKIGYAQISPEAVIGLIKGCKKLEILEIDNTRADNKVMLEFLSRPSSIHLSLIDCRAITSSAYSLISPSTRARAGWRGWESVPFGYDKDTELAPDQGMKIVLKTFWSWRRVVVPKGWKEMRNEAERLYFTQKESKSEGEKFETKQNPKRNKVQGFETMIRHKSRTYDNGSIGCIIG
ncbi:hypothetical protein L204_105927 [Cryptococcus depauperatus]|nr:hypothetical protein L204_05050 [Cryptococcus depauperatus CBS 7855]